MSNFEINSSNAVIVEASEAFSLSQEENTRDNNRDTSSSVLEKAQHRIEEILKEDVSSAHQTSSR